MIYHNAFQALAIDENRWPYDATLWTKYTPKHPDPSSPTAEHKEPIVEQRWFIGAHANVGGGYRDDKLAQVPLAWLVAKATERGLLFRFPVPLDGSEHMSAVKDSYSEFLYGLFRVLTLGHRFYRAIGRPSRDVGEGLVDTVNETIDATVFDRWHRDPHYRPQNLAAWAQARGVDAATLSATVSATTALPVEKPA